MDLTMANPHYPTSTLERPAERLLKNFKVSQVGNDTIGTYLRGARSLAICCKDCPRMIEWTPPELERRFPPHLRIADWLSGCRAPVQADAAPRKSRSSSISTTSPTGGSRLRRARANRPGVMSAPD
jgi:hypothetical protein